MKSKHIQLTLGSVLAAGALSLAATGNAIAEYPEKPIKIYVGFSAGGGTDTTARGFSSYMHEVPEMNGMPAVVVNKPGGTGMIAAKVAKDARPDGYTLYMINAGTFSITHMKSFGKSPVDPLNDFQILGCMSQLVTSLQVPADSEIKSAADFAAWAKANEGKLRWANSGAGSLHTLAGHLLLDSLGVKHQPIPFKGGSKARNAIAAKKVKFAFNGVHMAAGFESKIRVLAVTSSDRDPVNPKVPTLGESNLPGLGIVGPMCLWGSKDLPKDVVTKLQAAVKHVTGIKGFGRFMKKSKLAAIYASPEDGTAKTKALYTKLQPVVEKIFKKK
ncbi:MAG: Bug family tripartite tricarboxylate transporter substrate binding protein [Hyphomicrobiaceae bacterium]